MTDAPQVALRYFSATIRLLELADHLGHDTEFNDLPASTERTPIDAMMAGVVGELQARQRRPRRT